MAEPPESPLIPDPALYGDLPPVGCAFTPLRILGLAFVGWPIWNGVLWALVGDMGVGLDAGPALQLFELASVSTFLLAVFGVRTWVRRRRRRDDPPTAPG